MCDPAGRQHNCTFIGGTCILFYISLRRNVEHVNIGPQMEPVGEGDASRRHGSQFTHTPHGAVGLLPSPLALQLLQKSAGGGLRAGGVTAFTQEPGNLCASTHPRGWRSRSYLCSPMCGAALARGEAAKYNTLRSHRPTSEPGDGALFSAWRVRLPDTVRVRATFLVR